MRKKFFTWLTAVVVAITMTFGGSAAAVFAAEPDQEAGFLEELSIAGSSSASAVKMEMTPEFSPEVKDYTMMLPDSTASCYVFAKLSEDGAGAQITAKWNDCSSGAERTLEIPSGSTSGKYLNGFFKAGAACGRTLEMEVKKGEQIQTYTVKTTTERTLSDLKVTAGGKQLKMKPAFNRNTKDYHVKTTRDQGTVTVTAVPAGDSYNVTVDGKTMEGGKAEVELGADAEKIIPVNVAFGSEDNSKDGSYSLTVERADAVNAAFSVTPSDAVIFMQDDQGQTIRPDEKGIFHLVPGADYHYNATRAGYVGQSSTLNIDKDTDVTIDLALAEKNDAIKTDLPAQWKNFRNSDANMAITPAKTPFAKETTEFKWAKKLGSGWGNAPSVQIIVDDAIIVLSADKIFKLDPDSGEILKEAQLAAKIDYGYTPPTYADGIIFCPLNGTVQAVNADTLESLWVYKDPIGGQALSPITCHNGYVYTGFWKQETADANYVCLSAADEDPSKTDEPKLATWTHTQKGGFYWAGSAAVGDAIIFGTDDGESGATSPTSKLMSVNGITGEVIASLDLTGDQRSAIAYDKESGRVFGTTKAGFLFSAAVGKDGSLSDLKQQQYGNNSQQMSTSSPVVYKGKAYIGFANTGNFGKENYLIAADANTLEEVYRVPLKGYPQGSVLMSTAYEDTEGKVCMYLSYNAQPGGITCIKAAPDETDAANVEVDEIYDAKGYEQYCITSIICGQDGTLYYKNDSSNVLAVGRVKKQDADLELLEVNESDTFGGSSIKPTTPDFDKNTVSYTAFNVTSDRTFANLWADAADKNASVKVYASAGAKADDEETGEIKGLNPGNTHTRYPVCFADESKTAVVRVEVTADDGKTQKTYYVVITKEPAGSDVDEALTDIVRGFADKNDYEKEEQAEIDIILKDLQRQLKSADNMEDKEIIIAKAKLDISKVETGESIAAKQLERVKRTAIDELKTAMPDLSEYRLQQQFDLMVILMEGQTQIERAENPDQVDQQLVRAKEKMAAVATNYELTIAETKANLETAVTAGTSASCNAVQVKWNRISGADGYQVMRAESASGTYTAVADTASVSFTDKKVSLGKTYYYKVRAYAAVEDETFYGNYSAVKTAKPVLSAPASVKAKAGRKQASISWKKTAGAGGYKVYRAVKKNGKYKTVKTITKASTVKYTNKKLKKGKTYYYKVRAYKKANGKTVYSGYSKIVKVRAK